MTPYILFLLIFVVPFVAAPLVFLFFDRRRERHWRDYINRKGS